MLLEFSRELESRPVNPEDLPAGVPEAEVKSVRRVRRGRRNLAAFDNLPVTRKEHDLPEDQKRCPCCGEMRLRIGQESSWQVEFIPGHFERIEHVRIKYACKHCEQNAENPNIALADKPAQPIEKGMAGPGLLAYVVTSKFADYLPLYRLESIFQRNGLEISRATQSVWCRDVAEIVKPLYDLMIQRMLQSHVICTDDTVMPMLWPEKTKQARMWVCIGDGHNPYNLFYFTLGRGRDGPATFLKGYKQTLVADAYGGYDGVVVGNDITRAGCWAHGRRRFVDAEKSHSQIAAEAVGLIKRLYAVEERGKALDVPTRLALRQSESIPILSSLKDRLFTWRDQLLPKHPMSEAVGYLLNQWTELNVFTRDGAVPLDNNISEREMKRICLNRKNSLFVGNERGGQTAAILSSLTSTCRRHAIDPQRYLTQLLTNLPATPMSQLEQWLPDEWKRRNPSTSR
jgi:transposase